MAKARAHVNKSQMIRDMLQAHPEMSPSQIAGELKKKGLDLSAQYVSTIKSNSKAKKPGKRPVMKSVARKTATRQVGDSMTSLTAAVGLIKAAGGLEQARETLGLIEQISQVV